MKINENLKQNITSDLRSILNKRMMIIFVLLFITYTISDMGAVFFLIPLCFALIPFRNDEYQSISMPEKTEDTIRARYIFSLLLLLAVILISLVTSNIVSMFTDSSINLIPIYSIILMIILFLFSAGLLLPVFYRFGFKKSQYALYVLVIGFAIVNLYQSRIPFFIWSQDFINNNPWYVFTGIGIVAGSIVFAISYLVACRLTIKK